MSKLFHSLWILSSSPKIHNCSTSSLLSDWCTPCTLFSIMHINWLMVLLEEGLYGNWWGISPIRLYSISTYEEPPSYHLCHIIRATGRLTFNDVVHSDILTCMVNSPESNWSLSGSSDVNLICNDVRGRSGIPSSMKMDFPFACLKRIASSWCEFVENVVMWSDGRLVL